MKLASGLVAGTTYTYAVTYVSHGTGSTGAFNPVVYTNNAASLTGAFLLGNMPAVGGTWTTKTLSFTATAAQAGHNWLMFGTWSSFSSGFINSFCSTCNSTLPIELISFNVKSTADGKVLAEWSTATEKNNSYFLLQRSLNGVDFDNAAISIKGAGNSSEVKHYSIIDPTPYRGTSYYRLQQVDADGRTTYLPIQSVTLIERRNDKLYPNPTSDIINLPYSESATDIVITDHVGKTLMRAPYAKTIDVSGLDQGYYILKVYAASQPLITYKFVKQ